MQESNNFNDGNDDWITIDKIYGLESSYKLGTSVSSSSNEITVIFATSAPNGNSESLDNNVVVRTPFVDH